MFAFDVTYLKTTSSILQYPEGEGVGTHLKPWRQRLNITAQDPCKLYWGKLLSCACSRPFPWRL